MPILRLAAAAAASALSATTVYAQPPPPTEAPSTAPGPPPAQGQADLATKLQNPVSDLISVPFQNNWDWSMGPNGEGSQWKLNIQPVIPIALNDRWNVISRTIVPLVAQGDVVNLDQQSGLGDITQSLFFSPRAPGPGGWIWGVGPVFLIPTATDHSIGTEKWGAGPTAVVLRQQSGWSYGALVNHLWSFAGDDDRSDVNATFLQPFLSFTTKSGTTYSLNSETTYDWEREDWTVPINLGIAHVFRTGRVPLQLQGGYRWYAEKPDGGPDAGVRLTVTALFPK
jgi:hypothetical protein